MKKTVVVLATLDTKGEEAAFLKRQVESLGAAACLLDMGVLGHPETSPDIYREEVAEAGGTTLEALLEDPSREGASPVMVRGAAAILREGIAGGEYHAVLGLGGTQGTSNASAVMQQLPYGFPKLMVSTVASGDTAPFVGIKDVTMMFSVGDILGLNPLTRKILANAAAAAVGMANCLVTLEQARGERPTIGMTNLGVLTEGAMHALRRFAERGYEVIVFHAVGSGGRAMEQLMREGVLGAVFDYALGEITDQLFGGLRAADATRLTVAGELGLPQVLCPGGLEHVGLMVPAHTVPERWQGRPHVFHNPIILAPRLTADEMRAVAREIAQRLTGSRGPVTFLMPTRGTSRYGIAGGPLHDPEGDAAFLEELRRHLPPTVELLERDAGAEDPAFVDEAVERLLALVEQRAG